MTFRIRPLWAGTPKHEGKVRYGHQETAEKACADLLKKHGEMEAYFCPKCEGWHIGHIPSLLEFSID